MRYKVVLLGRYIMKTHEIQGGTVRVNDNQYIMT
jgi:hypothetical protein